MLGGVPRVSKALVVACLAIALVGCRSATEFFAHPRPRPVPTDPRTGWAHYELKIDSRAKRRVRVGKDGPWLEPGASIVVDRSIPPQRLGHEKPRDRFAPRNHAVRTDLIELIDGDTRTVLSVDVLVFLSGLEEEKIIPLPRIAGGAPRVTAGIHAPNHRRPGRRYAVDLVPSGATAALGARVDSPVDARVVAVRKNEADRPGGRPNEILLQCDDGMVLLLSHFEKGSIPWRPDERVRRGQLLGRIGLSGETSGAHLHVELLRAARGRPAKLRRE